MSFDAPQKLTRARFSVASGFATSGLRGHWAPSPRNSTAVRPFCLKEAQAHETDDPELMPVVATQAQAERAEMPLRETLLWT